MSSGGIVPPAVVRFKPSVLVELPGTIEFLEQYAGKLDLRGYPVHADEIRKLVRFSLEKASVVEVERGT